MPYPSTFVDLQDAVINKLRLDATADRAKVRDWINQVYAQVCVETEATATTATLTLTADTYSYNLGTLSSSIIRVKQMSVSTVGGAGYGPSLIETSLEDILDRRRYGGTTANGSGPTHYALLGMNQLELWPTPGSADSLLVYYIGLPTALSANADTPAIPEPYASKLLEYGALAEGSDFLKGADDPATQQYRSLYTDWLKRFRGQLYKRAGGHMQQLAVVGLGWRPPHDRSVDIGV